MTDVPLELLEAAAYAAVAQAESHTPRPRIQQGVLVDPDAHGPRIHSVLIDGDTEPSPCHDITNGYGIPVGVRVSLLFAPPHQMLIIGVIPNLGIIAQFNEDTSGSTLSASGATDMLLTDVPLIADRTYGVHLHSILQLDSVAVDARWTLDMDVNGSNVGRFYDLQPRVTGSSQWHCSGWDYYTPTTTDIYDITVLASEVVNGANLTLEASAGAIRRLTVHDFGVRLT